MADTKDLLERASQQFPPHEHLVERLVDRRARKRRNSRIGAALVSITVAMFGIGTVIETLNTGQQSVGVGGSSIVDRISVPGAASVVTGGGFVWVNAQGGSVVRLDPSTGEVLSTTRFSGRGDSGLAFGAGALWVCDRNSVAKVDSATGEIIGRAVIATVGDYALFADGSVWVTGGYTRGSNSWVSRIDPATMTVVATIDIGPHDWGPLAAEGNDIWVSLSDGGGVLRIDASTNTVVGSVTVGGPPSALAVTPGVLWATAIDHTGIGVNGIFRIDTSTGNVSPVVDLPMGPQAQGIAVAKGSVWVSITDYGRAGLKGPFGPITGSLIRIDAATGAIVETLALPSAAYDVAADGNVVWVTSETDGQLLRISPGA
ncbi:MAG: hypothetical protein ABI869_04460 [Actinomycetota bacterium]